MPPFDMPRVPVMSDARLMRDVDTEPAVAFNIPEREPSERDPKKAEVLDAYEEERLVVEAF